MQIRNPSKNPRDWVIAMAKILMTFRHLPPEVYEQHDFNNDLAHGWYWPDYPGIPIGWGNGFCGFCTVNEFSNLSASLIQAAYDFDTFTGVRVEMLFRELNL